MKKVFRLFSLLLALLLFGALLSPSSIAAPKEAGLIRIIGETSGKRGEEISFEVELNRNPGVTSLRLTLQYDRDALELLSVEDKALLPNANFTDSVSAEKFILHWQSLSAEDLVQTGRLCSLSFRVKTDAPYSTEGVTLSYSDAELDIVNHNHSRVPFEIEKALFTVPCLHPDAEERILRQASLEKAGERQISCKACGTTVIESILPTLESEDKSIRATVSPGEFVREPEEGEEAKAPSVSLEKITSGSSFDEAILASAAYNGTVTDVFQIHFTRRGEAFVPLSKVQLTLSESAVKTDENSVLFRILPDGKTEKVEFEKDGGITFPYSDCVYFLMDSSLPPLNDTPPATTAPAPSEAPIVKKTDTLTPILVGSGGLVLLLAIALIVFFLRRPKKDDLD